MFSIWNFFSNIIIFKLIHQKSKTSSIHSIERLSIFLIFYGFLRVKSALNPKGLEIDDSESKELWPTILAGLAFTYLNRHVYVDTLLLIGGASSSYTGDDKVMFGVGAATASFVFFFSLGYGAKRLSPILNTPESWNIIDFFIAGVLFTVAGILLLPYLT